MQPHPKIPTSPHRSPPTAELVLGNVAPRHSRHSIQALPRPTVRQKSAAPLTKQGLSEGRFGRDARLLGPSAGEIDAEGRIRLRVC